MNLPFSHIDPISTPRLVLRPFRPDDLRALGSLQRAPGVSRFVPWEPPDPDDLDWRLERKLSATVLVDDGDVLSFAVVPRTGGSLIGDMTLVLASAEHHQVEVGYVLHPDHHGQGLATEALRAVLTVAFDELGAHRAFGRIDTRNSASAAVLRRVGMRHEALLRENELEQGQWTDESIFAIIDHEFAAHRGHLNDDRPPTPS